MRTQWGRTVTERKRMFDTIFPELNGERAKLLQMVRDIETEFGAAISDPNKRRLQAFKMYWGLDGVTRTYREVGEEMGISISRARELELHIRWRIRRYLRLRS